MNIVKHIAFGFVWLILSATALVYYFSPEAGAQGRKVETLVIEQQVDMSVCGLRNCLTHSDSLVPRSISSLAVPLTENFDTLASSSTSDVVPTGWAFLETGTNANTLYSAGNGGSATGDTYSFGSIGSTDRAFGGLRSGALVPLIGATFANASGADIASVRISYTGEEWRFGASGRGSDRLEFQYSTDATALNNGTWTSVPELNFETPNLTGLGGPRDGNASANRTQISKWFNVNVPNGGSIWIRWVDFDAPNSDDGLAIDDFSLTAYAIPSAAPASITGRVVSSDGRGISGAVVSVVGGELAGPVSVRTNSFGFYRIENLPVGGIYFLTASAGKFAAASETRSVELSADLADVNFQFPADIR